MMSLKSTIKFVAFFLGHAVYRVAKKKRTTNVDQIWPNLVISWDRVTF